MKKSTETKGASVSKLSAALTIATSEHLGVWDRLAGWSDVRKLTKDKAQRAQAIEMITKLEAEIEGANKAPETAITADGEPEAETPRDPLSDGITINDRANAKPRKRPVKASKTESAPEAPAKAKREPKVKAEAPKRPTYRERIASGELPETTSTGAPFAHDPRVADLVGSKLTHEGRDGIKHTLRVERYGFTLIGRDGEVDRPFRSLTKAAQHVTGGPVSGFVFWGLAVANLTPAKPDEKLAADFLAASELCNKAGVKPKMTNEIAAYLASPDADTIASLYATADHLRTLSVAVARVARLSGLKLRKGLARAERKAKKAA